MASRDRQKPDYDGQKKIQIMQKIRYTDLEIEIVEKLLIVNQLNMHKEVADLLSIPLPNIDILRCKGL